MIEPREPVVCPDCGEIHPLPSTRETYELVHEFVNELLDRGASPEAVVMSLLSGAAQVHTEVMAHSGVSESRSKRFWQDACRGSLKDAVIAANMNTMATAPGSKALS